MKCGSKNCNKTIALSLQYSCKCGLMYCRIHVNCHDCSYDYKLEQKNKLEKELEKVISNKIDKI